MNLFLPLFLSLFSLFLLLPMAPIFAQDPQGPRPIAVDAENFPPLFYYSKEEALILNQKSSSFLMIEPDTKHIIITSGFWDNQRWTRHGLHQVRVSVESQGGQTTRTYWGIYYSDPALSHETSAAETPFQKDVFQEGVLRQRSLLMKNGKVLEQEFKGPEEELFLKKETLRKNGETLRTIEYTFNKETGRYQKIWNELTSPHLYTTEKVYFPFTFVMGVPEGVLQSSGEFTHDRQGRLIKSETTTLNCLPKEEGKSHCQGETFSEYDGQKRKISVDTTHYQTLVFEISQNRLQYLFPETFHHRQFPGGPNSPSGYTQTQSTFDEKGYPVGQHYQSRINYHGGHGDSFVEYLHSPSESSKTAFQLKPDGSKNMTLKLTRTYKGDHSPSLLLSRCRNREDGLVILEMGCLRSIFHGETVSDWEAIPLSP